MKINEIIPLFEAVNEEVLLLQFIQATERIAANPFPTKGSRINILVQAIMRRFPECVKHCDMYRVINLGHKTILNAENASDILKLIKFNEIDKSGKIYSWAETPEGAMYFMQYRRSTQPGGRHGNASPKLINVGLISSMVFLHQKGPCLSYDKLFDMLATKYNMFKNYEFSDEAKAFMKHRGLEWTFRGGISQTLISNISLVHEVLAPIDNTLRIEYFVLSGITGKKKAEKDGSVLPDDPTMMRAPARYRRKELIYHASEFDMMKKEMLQQLSGVAPPARTKSNEAHPKSRYHALSNFLIQNDSDTTYVTDTMYKPNRQRLRDLNVR